MKPCRKIPSRMHHRFLALSVLGLLLLTACGGNALEVRNSNDRIVGTIDVQGTKTATILNTHGDVLGKVRGNIIRDDAGKKAGSITEQNGGIVILDAKDDAAGSIEGANCYGKGKEKLGSVSGETDAYVVAAACLVFFLQ